MLRQSEIFAETTNQVEYQDYAVSTLELNKNNRRRRELGAYYTPTNAGDFLAQWIVRKDGEHFLEPSLGDGNLVCAVSNKATQRGFTNVHFSGVEINPCAASEFPQDSIQHQVVIHNNDFLAVQPFPVDAVIGNPPYVRIRNLDARASALALESSGTALGHKVDPSGSLWLPFIIHATKFIVTGGRLALVLPYEATYVRYARSLWQFLGNRFGSVKVIRTHERLFPDIYQEVILLLADDFGAHTDHVLFEAYNSVDDLKQGKTRTKAKLPIRDLHLGKRLFVEALLSNPLRELLTRISPYTKPASNFIKFNIGYVSGDKSFFHPSEPDIAKYLLPKSSLHKTICSTRAMKQAGIYSSNLKQVTYLYSPSETQVSEGERLYHAIGLESGVAERYKCRVRNPWYVVPGLHIPDLLFSVFAERPVLMVNDAKLLASNSILCGYCREGVSSEQVAAAWYTSLTLLQCELEVHALGGGVMVMVPHEAGKVKLPLLENMPSNYSSEVEFQLKSGNTLAAYQAGDIPILKQAMGLSEREIDLIKEGIQELTFWRTAHRAE